MKINFYIRMGFILSMLLIFNPLQGQVENKGNGLVIKDKFIMLVLDRNTTKEELLRYQQILDEQYNISLNYELTFDDESKIKKIKLEVDCHDGHKGKYKTKFRSENQKAGFYRIWDSRYKVPFAVCNLPRIFDLEKEIGIE